MNLVDEVYALARQLPEQERFGLYSRVTRAAVSIPANIAEGHGRSGPREFANFVSISRGSLAELDCLVEIVRRQGFATADEAASIHAEVDAIGRMLTALGQRLREARR